MDLRKLEYFTQIVECGGFNKAAALLHLAPSALSRQIRQLEHELGAQLFERSARGAHLTAAGTLVSQRAQALIRDIEALRDAVRTPSKTTANLVSIGIPSVLRSILAAPLLAQINANHPSLQIALTMGMSPEIRRAIIKGGLDFGAYGSLETDLDLRSRPVLFDDLMVVGSRGSAIAGRSEINPEELSGLPLVVISRESLNRLLRMLGSEAEIDLGSVVEVSDGPLQVEMAMSGRYCSILPRVMVQDYLEDGDLCGARLPGVQYCWRIGHAADRPLSDAARQAFRLLSECAAERWAVSPA